MRNTYRIPIFQINWNSPDLIDDILEMTFVYGLCIDINIKGNQ